MISIIENVFKSQKTNELNSGETLNEASEETGNPIGNASELTDDRKKVLDEIHRYQNSSPKRLIKEIAVHCSATKPGTNVTIEKLDEWHKARGFKKQSMSGHYCGYHFVINIDGKIMFGRNIQEIGAHVTGHNNYSIGICYVGGLNEKGKASDTRTDEQKDTLIWLIRILKENLNIKIVKGHRDYSLDKNGDGIITKDEWMKECPCFNAQTEYENI